MTLQWGLLHRLRLLQTAQHGILLLDQLLLVSYLYLVIRNDLLKTVYLPVNYRHFLLHLLL